MERLTKDEYGCLLALSASSRSEDEHTRVGAAGMTLDGRIIGLSYNGLKSGMIMPDWMKLEENRTEKGKYMIHSEANICSLFKRGEVETIYLTISPCISCCNILLAQDVKRVVFIEEYHRCNKYKEIFDFYGIFYREISQAERNRIRFAFYDMILKIRQ